MAHKLTWKRVNEHGEHMTQCGRYWFSDCGELTRLWHEDSGNIVDYFDSTQQAKQGAQRHLESLHNPNVFTCNESVDGPLSPGYYGS